MPQDNPHPGSYTKKCGTAESSKSYSARHFPLTPLAAQHSVCTPEEIDGNEQAYTAAELESNTEDEWDLQGRQPPQVREASPEEEVDLDVEPLSSHQHLRFKERATLDGKSIDGMRRPRNRARDDRPPISSTPSRSEKAVDETADWATCAFDLGTF